MRALALALILAVPLAVSTTSAHANPFGAYTTGIEITQQQMDTLEVGKTTQDNIREKFGAPGRREQLGDTQVWYYDFVKIKSFGKNIQEATVLDHEGVGEPQVRALHLDLLLGDVLSEVVAHRVLDPQREHEQEDDPQVDGDVV